MPGGGARTQWLTGGPGWELVIEREGATSNRPAAVVTTASAERRLGSADAVATRVTEDGTTGQVATGELWSLDTRALYDRADRPRLQPVRDMPAVLQRCYLIKTWWKALDAPSRHYLKRRVVERGSTPRRSSSARPSSSASARYARIWSAIMQFEQSTLRFRKRCASSCPAGLKMNCTDRPPPCPSE